MRDSVCLVSVGGSCRIFSTCVLYFFRGTAYMHSSCSLSHLWPSCRISCTACGALTQESARDSRPLFQATFARIEHGLSTLACGSHSGYYAGSNAERVILGAIQGRTRTRAAFLPTAVKKMTTSRPRRSNLRAEFLQTRIVESYLRKKKNRGPTRCRVKAAIPSHALNLLQGAFAAFGTSARLSQWSMPVSNMRSTKHRES